MTITVRNIGGIMDENGGFVYWDSENESRCRECDALMVGETHKSFLFVSHPDDLDVPPSRTSGQPRKVEWRPEPEYPDASCDEGPHRAAYYLEGKPTVMVFEGPCAHYSWTPCAIYSITLGGCQYWKWICRRQIKDPCDTEYLKGIST